MSPDPARRLLLVELVISDPWVYNGRAFPYLAGLAEQHGVPATWLCLGVRYGHVATATGFRQFAHLDDADVATLKGALAELRPTHVVLSDTLCDEHVDALFGPKPRPRVVVTSDRPVTDPRLASAADLVAAASPLPGALDADERRWAPWTNWKLARTDWFLDWLGEDRGTAADFGRYLAGAARPSYRARMANEAGRRFRPSLMLVGGVACDHRAEVRRNPCFQGLDLAPGTVEAGCSFCGYFRGPTSDPGLDAIELAAAQLEAIRDDCASPSSEANGPDGRFFGVIDVHDVRVFRRLDELVDRLERLRFPPCTFVVSPRIDRFLDAPLEAVLPRFERGGYRLAVYRMGGESLVDATNQLFNKHVTLEQLDRARERWQRLLHLHPGAFAYDGTLGAITYTPWTTLDELAWLFDAALARGFAEDDVWVYTPLELQGDTAITQLARRDGLVVERFDDPAFLYKLFLNNIAPDSLLPWRFRDASVGPAFGLIVRYHAAATRDRFPDAVFDGDPLYAVVRAHHDACAAPRPSPARFALTALHTWLATPGATPEQVLALSLAAAPNADASSPSAVSPGPAPSGAQARWSAAVQRVARWADQAVNGLHVELDGADDAGAQLTVALDRARYRLFVSETTDTPCLLRTSRLAVSHAAETPVDPRHLPHLRLLARALERVLDQGAGRLNT